MRRIAEVEPRGHYVEPSPFGPRRGGFRRSIADSMAREIHAAAPVALIEPSHVAEALERMQPSRV